ncbi:glycosyltransferase family 4 protein [candidate division KSB1 bacterium]|nr:glycosyltransferase family 4 protein [candidate division KSB1 bacterium]
MKAKQYKILYIITGLRIGGAEKLLYQVAKHLDPENIRVEIIYFDRKAAMMPLFEQLRVTVTRYKYTLLSVFPLIRHMRRCRFDAVHTHLVFADIIGRLAALFVPVKVFSSVHGTEWYHLRSTLGARTVRLADKLLALWSRGKYIAVSAAVKDVLVNRVGIEPGSVTVLYNAVPLAKGQTEIRPKSLKFRILFVGRLIKTKNVACLIRALALLKNTNICLTVVGEGPCASMLHSLAAEKKLGKSVVFKSALLDVKEYYQNHDVLVLPSLFEGLGIVILEAFSYGLPVIGSAVGGITELLENNRGLLFESNNHRDLAQKIQTLYKNDRKRRELGQNGLEYVKKNHDIKDYVHKLCQLYGF